MTAELGAGPGGVAGARRSTALPPVFEPRRDAVLLAAACRLADLGARLHPDHRADLAFEQVLRAPIAGQTHAERAFLAVAAFARHTTAATAEPSANAPACFRPSAATAPGRWAFGHPAGLRPLRPQPAGPRSRDPRSRQRRPGPHRRRKYADLLLGEQTTKRPNTLADALEVQAKVRAD